jgi:GR25 family glycosyltransferase involved in LPS biosynthesis
MDRSSAPADPDKDKIAIEFETGQLLDLLAMTDSSSWFYKHASGLLDAGLVLGAHQPDHRRQPGSRKLLTIGMAVYDDYDGVYFSVQGLRLYHPEVADDTEILVIDNHPGGAAAEALRGLEHWVKGYRYIPFDRVRGTAVRDLIFREANGDFVLCMDCHVLFPPGSLRELVAYIRAHPQLNNLLQGPMMSDDLTTLATHFDPVWSAGMWGVWGCDERAHDPHAPPFEIPMQGLGVFACRKDAWPGLNPRLRGFGGEEGCLHEKFRRRGASTLCLPFLRWLHRFERPFGLRYETTWEDRIRNYLILFDELEMDASPVVRHFEELLPVETVQAVVEAVTEEIRNPFHFFDAIYCINLDRERERWEEVHERFQALGISERVHRFSAIETPHSHHIGCALSHRTIVAEASRLGFNNVLVFEDDVIFSADTPDVLEGAIHELRQRTWWMLFLGGHTWEQTHAKAGECEFLAIPDGMTSAHAVAYNHTIYDRILAEVPESPSAMALWLRTHYGIDQYFKDTLGEFRLVTRPIIATQPPILSQERRPFDETYLARHADWSGYYKLAETDTIPQWRLLQSFIKEAPKPDLAAVLDFACGHGRIAERFAGIAGSLVCCDIGADAIAFCRRRFADSPNVTCVVNDSRSIPLPDESLTFVYSWDSMVNFSIAEMRTYLREFRRILKPGGMALVHHSNYGALGGTARLWNENPACRAYVSASDVRMISGQCGLPIVRQRIIDWTEPCLDCLTLFRKRCEAARGRPDPA